MYKGYTKLSLTNEELANFYQNVKNFEVDVNENEYLTIEKDEEVVDYFVKTNGELQSVVFPFFESSFCGKIKPRNSEQHLAMDLILKKDVPIKVLTGCFGSGKSLLMINGAMHLLQRNKFDKIIYIRNNIQVKDTDALGALPGDELTKLFPYLMPFADHCGGIDGLQMLIDQKRLEIIPLAFLRGRSLRNSIIYSTESENLTKEHIQLLIGRVDEGSELWIEGDIKQRDRAIFEKSQGMEKLINSLKGHRLFGYVHLEKSERSETARLADLLD